eukprot:COSAG02_NODE_45869_length_353_cov_1.114173_1_plen_77_part_10
MHSQSLLHNICVWERLWVKVQLLPALDTAPMLATQEVAAYRDLTTRPILRVLSAVRADWTPGGAEGIRIQPAGHRLR